MYIGAGIITIKIPYSNSLKEKRAVVNSIKRKLINIFTISIAEVGSLNILNSAEIGFAVVSKDKDFIHTIINRILDFIDSNFDVIIISEEFDILQY